MDKVLTVKCKSFHSPFFELRMCAAAEMRYFQIMKLAHVREREVSLNFVEKQMSFVLMELLLLGDSECFEQSI